MLLFVVVIVLSLSRLRRTAAQKEDTWRHYSDGGMFITAAPDLSPGESDIVYSSSETGHGDIYIYDLKSQKATQ